MKLKPSLLVLAMGLAIGTSAHATTPIFEWTDSFSAPGTLSKEFDITDTSVSYVVSFIDTGLLADFDFMALGVFKTGGPAMGSVVGQGSFSFVAPTVGSYTAIVYGDPGTFAGSYTYSTFSMNVTPVPEPETWAMLLAGLGLVGLQLRRKMKAVDRIALN